MPMLERRNPESPCQPNKAHHPHREVCSDYDCGYNDYDPEDDIHNDKGILLCCVCGQDWPCRIKREHVAKRKGITNGR